MRPITQYIVLWLGTTLPHLGSAKHLPPTPQCLDSNGPLRASEVYQMKPRAAEDDETDDVSMPEIPNATEYPDNDPFYLDDFEARRENMAPPPYDSNTEPEPSITSTGEDSERLMRTEGNIQLNNDPKEKECNGINLAPEVRCKGVLAKPRQPIDRPRPDPAALDVSKEMSISEIKRLDDDTRPKLIPKICKSREFQLKLENYWISGADKFLRDYTSTHQSDPSYQSYGLFKSLAKKYLGESHILDCSFQGGIFSSKTCRITCNDILQKVEDLEVARKLYFVLSAGIGLFEVLGTMHNSFSQIPERLASMMDHMHGTEYALTEFRAQDMLLTVAQYYSDALRHAVVAAVPWPPVEKITEKARAGLARARNDYDSAVQVYGMVEGGDDPYKWDKLFNPNYEMTLSDIDFASSDAPEKVAEVLPRSTEGWHGKTVERTRQVLLDYVAFIRSIEANELSQARTAGYGALDGLLNRIASTMGAETNILSGGVSGELGTRSKAGIKNAVEDLLLGRSADPNGSTTLSRLLSFGNFLPMGNKAAISKFRNANPVERMTKNIFMRLFDLSFEKKKIYISCTKDAQMRADSRKDQPGQRSSCDKDNTGPQNLKACVEDYVCYMYRWSERNLNYLSHNRMPKDMDKWDEPPFSITPEDIITSSVHSRLQGLDRGKGEYPLEAVLNATREGLSSLGNPRNAGIFHIPVCFSRHNWNTQVTGWNTLCDTDPNCPAKNFPCFCGPWGKETESVWREMGVWDGKKKNYYARDLCPRQISRKISDPLERYIAYCTLDVRRNTCSTRVNGLIKYAGKDKYCALLQSVMDLKGYESVADMDPEIKFAFTCKIKKGGRGCSMYDKMFESLWRAALDAGYLAPEDRPDA